MVASGDAPNRHALASFSLSSLAIGAVLTTGIVSALVLAAPDLRHWFIVPCTLAGMVLATDVVDWLRSRIDVYAPVGILGVLGFHLVCTAPLLHIYWDFHVPGLTVSGDWRDWLGWLSWLNLAGMILYRLGRGLKFGPLAGNPQTTWQIAPKRFALVVIGMLVVSGGLQAFVYYIFGGIQGYMAAASLGTEADFRGLGPVFMISEAFPIIAMIGVAAFMRYRNWRPSWPILMVILLIYFMLSILFGGLQGSRSAIIWDMFWAVGVLHFFIRPLTRTYLALGLCFLIVFVVGYRYITDYGAEFFEVLSDPTRDLAELREATEDKPTYYSVVLGDFSRAGIQALLLNRQFDPRYDYNYAYGQTYLSAALLVIPDEIWHGRPPTAQRWGTNMLFGEGSWTPDRSFESSRVYGLGGEAMLNFGPMAVPFAYLVMGVLVGVVSRHIQRFPSTDSRLLLVPFLVNFAFSMLVSDSHNLVYFAFEEGFMPIFLLIVGSKRLSLAARPSGTSGTRRGQAPVQTA